MCFLLPLPLTFVLPPQQQPLTLPLLLLLIAQHGSVRAGRVLPLVLPLPLPRPLGLGAEALRLHRETICDLAPRERMTIGNALLCFPLPLTSALPPLPLSLPLPLLLLLRAEALRLLRVAYPLPLSLRLRAESLLLLRVLAPRERVRAENGLVCFPRLPLLRALHPLPVPVPLPVRVRAKGPLLLCVAPFVPASLVSLNQASPREQGRQCGYALLSLSPRVLCASRARAKADHFDTRLTRLLQR